VDQDVLADAVSAQLDALDSLVTATVGLALLAAVAATQAPAIYELFSLKLSRDLAFAVLVSVFTATNFAALLYFLRISALVAMCDTPHLPKLLTKLFTHKWIFNPYSDFGGGLARFHSSIGFGALIVMWWIGYTTLLLVSDNQIILRYAAMGPYLAIGFFSVAVISRSQGLIAQRAKTLAPFADHASALLAAKRFATMAGIGVGGLIYLIAQAPKLLGF